MRSTRFIIISQPRSGSTLLRASLNSHPNICCQGELYAEGRPFAYELNKVQGTLAEIEAKLKAIRDRISHQEFMDTYVFPSDHEWPAIGLKLLDLNFEYPEVGPFLKSYVLENPEIKLIFLHREDQLERFISHRVFAKKLSLDVKQNVDLDDFKTYMARFHWGMERIWYAFPEHQKFYISYEGLIADIPAALAEIVNFIGVAESSYKILGKKSQPRYPQNFLLNYPELEEIWQMWKPRYEEIYKDFPVWRS